MLNVDPDELRSLASSMESVAGLLDALEVRTAANAVGAALPGADLADVCASSGEVTETAFRRMGARCRRISQIAKGSADTFEITDVEFSKRITELGEA
ncbi:type VII secretion target [Nocardia sp. NPDC058658]|uniref:type VII secretion target n=1 Tax=Nocardia sp. NPDC058658 TaxID=3346580 RepID=UPI003651143B